VGSIRLQATPQAKQRGLALATCVAALVVAGCGDSGVSADAGEDFSVTVGEAPQFDGCDSSGDSLSYTWTIVEAPPDMADDTGKVLRQSITECAFTLESEMVVADTGAWVIELEVTDGSATASDQLTVTVT